MKLELNVVRFNNEDVIATSCNVDEPHFLFSNVKCNKSGNNHGSDNVLIYGTYLGQGEYMCAGPNAFTGHPEFNEPNVWYHYDLEKGKYVKCGYDGVKPSLDDFNSKVNDHSSY